MEDLKFIYVSYITAPIEKIWEALTDGEFTSKFWFGFRVESDWKIGSEVILHAPSGAKNEDVHGKVIEFDRPNKLTYSTHEGGSDARVKPARLTFELRAMGPVVKLTVTHVDLAPEDIEANPNAFRGVNNGWPAIISSLKSLVETGREISFGPPPR